MSIFTFLFGENAGMPLDTPDGEAAIRKPAAETLMNATAAKQITKQFESECCHDFLLKVVIERMKEDAKKGKYSSLITERELKAKVDTQDMSITMKVLAAQLSGWGYRSSTDWCAWPDFSADPCNSVHQHVLFVSWS